MSESRGLSEYMAELSLDYHKQVVKGGHFLRKLREHVQKAKYMLSGTILRKKSQVSSKVEY